MTAEEAKDIKPYEVVEVESELDEVYFLTCIVVAVLDGGLYVVVKETTKGVILTVEAEAVHKMY